MTLIPRTRQKGLLAIVVAVILLVVVAMGAAMFTMSTSGNRGAGDHANSGRALFLAESGIEWSAREMLGSENPEDDCNALGGSGPFNMPGGTFRILDSTYDTTDENCDVVSRGTVGDVIRTISGTIPKSIIEGGGGGLLDDSDDNFNQCNSQNIECQDGAIIFNRPGGGGGQPPAKANGSDVVSDDFSAGDTVYFTANIDWDSDPTGNIFSVKLRLQGQPDITCSALMPSLSSGCAAAPSNDLYDQYDLVFVLGDTFSAADINDVELQVDWSSNSSSQVTLSDACIGRENHCEGTSDPTEDGTWEENP